MSTALGDPALVAHIGDRTVPVHLGGGVLDGIGSDQRRLWSRIRHYYHFVPPAMDEVLIKHFDGEDLDYLMLSALAVS